MFIVLEDRRRQLLHLNVTDHPTTASTAQQIVEAFADRDVAQYLIRIGTASTARFASGSHRQTCQSN